MLPTKISVDVPNGQIKKDVLKMSFLDAAKAVTRWQKTAPEMQDLSMRWDLFWATVDCEKVNRKMNKRFTKIMNQCEFLIQQGRDPHEVLAEAWNAIEEWVLGGFIEYGSGDSEPRNQAIRLLNFYATKWVKWSVDDHHLIQVGDWN